MSRKITLKVHADQKTKELGDLFGIFFEDINHAADGGLYAEMVQNRSFEFDYTDNKTYHSLTAWECVQRGQAMVKLHVESTSPMNARNQHYLVMDVNRHGLGGVQNCGYHAGMWVQQGHTYLFSCWYHLRSRKPVEVYVRLESADGTACYAKQSFRADSTEWTKAELELTASATDAAARLVVAVTEPVSLALDMVSLFPKATFRQRRNGMRADLAQMLADMKPKFLRFPGGCLVHCGSLNAEDRESMYRWKATLGPVEERTTWRSIWQYNQSLGLGYYEYFQLCEDIGAQPLPVIPGGWDPHTLRGADMLDMQEWIDEALDLIEFANGSPDTTWGRVRCEMGHQEPFNLKYLAIGNEEVGEEFFQRYEMMHRAVQERYPDIQLIASSGPGCAGNVFDYGWAQARELGAAYVDEHFYQSPDWVIANTRRYDAYPANGPKAFLGEYASRGDTWWNALAEAAFMLGMEKAPGLGLACYAPLFCNVDYRNWSPDLIMFNQHQAYGTPSYHVQKLMMRHQGNHEVAVEMDAPPVESVPKAALNGEIAFKIENGDVTVADFIVTNLDSGETVTAEEFCLRNEESERAAARIDWVNYRIGFRVKRHGDCDERHHLGGRPFMMEFARKDENNKLRWCIDGWMSMVSMGQFTDGEFCEQVTNAHPHTKDVWYDYTVEIRGDIIDTAINGVALAQVRACQPVIEPLYTAASIDDESGELIVKVANLRAEPAEVALDLGSYIAEQVEVHQMAGFASTDRNSFDEPEKVAPVITIMPVNDNEWVFPAESLTVLRFRKRGEC